MPISMAHVSACYFFWKKFKILTVGPGHVSDTSTTRQCHADATRAPRGLHVGAAGRGDPAIAGDDSAGIGLNGEHQQLEGVEADPWVAAPLLCGRRSYGGERFGGGRRTVKMKSTIPCVIASEEGPGRELSSP